MLPKKFPLPLGHQTRVFLSIPLPILASISAALHWFDDTLGVILFRLINAPTTNFACQKVVCPFGPPSMQNSRSPRRLFGSFGVCRNVSTNEAIMFAISQIDFVIALSQPYIAYCSNHTYAFESIHYTNLIWFSLAGKPTHCILINSHNPSSTLGKFG